MAIKNPKEPMTFELLIYCSNCEQEQRQEFPYGSHVKRAEDWERRSFSAGSLKVGVHIVSCKFCGSLELNTRQQPAALASRPATNPKRFPIQVERGARPHPLTIPWHVAELAYSVYAQKYGTEQSLERLAERGGFAPGEMDLFLSDWRESAEPPTDEPQRCSFMRPSGICGLAQSDLVHGSDSADYAGLSDEQRKILRDEIGTHPFTPADERMYSKRDTEVLCQIAVAAEHTKHAERINRLPSCGVCGGYMVEIRGRYPAESRRVVCPTCLADRMNTIHEQSAHDYGVAYTDKSIAEELSR